MATDKEEERSFLMMSKEERCEAFSTRTEPPVPNSYKGNTLKEELILEHVIQYKKEFALTYDSKRELLLHPMNECRKYKFICTTVRPTKVPYPELYDFKKCARFISEFFEYEELNPPTKFPEIIPAPDNVISWQIGDCFDLSIVLCSLLIGVGYNAYVIYGKAPRFITSKDETKLPPPELPDDIRIIEPNIDETEEKVEASMKGPEEIFSKFDQEEAKLKEEEEKQEWIKNNVIDDDMPELERHDPYKERRIHCWVMLRKNPRLKEDNKNEEIFIEPSTGRLYGIKDSPYEKIDAMFNNKNFYINLHMEKKVEEIDWNLNKATNWEYVMLNARDEADREEGKEEGDEAEEEKVRVKSPGEEEKATEILDMPPPWPNKILIPLKKYIERSPTKTQVYFYSKTKVEKWAPYSQPDGMIMKIYNYRDYARFLLDSVEHRYRNRGDKKYKRIEYPYEHKTVDFYLPGQLWHWKRVEEVEASYKIIDFYPTNFQTGLVYREEIFGKKIIHRYRDRDDKVFERKILLDKDTKVKKTSYRFFLDTPWYDKEILIRKFTQKQNYNPMYPPETQIFKLSYTFQAETDIQVIHHYGKGKILSKPDNFSFKDDNSIAAGDKEDSVKKNEDDKMNWRIGINNAKIKFIDDFRKIEENYINDYGTSIKYEHKIARNWDKPTETNTELYDDGHDDQGNPVEKFPPILERSTFDQNSDDDDADLDKEGQDFTGNEESLNRIQHFMKIVEERKVLHDKKEVIKEEIIKAFKDEKTSTTNTLQELLKEHVEELQAEIDHFRQNEQNWDTQKVKEHADKIEDIQRKINIIYHRSHRHITKIMEELNTLLDEMDTSLKDYNY
ncbi:MAG: snapin/pallidin family protein [archaeon]|nr:snapin/pallidin family protein [archaeon]